MGDVAVQDEIESAIISFNQEKVDLLKDTICNGATDTELEMFMMVCKRTNLDPFARQIYSVARWDSTQRKNVRSTQTSIDGFRLIADRTGKYEGQTPAYWCGSDGVWKDVWLSDLPPAAARVGVWKKGAKEATWGVARFSSYAQTKKGGDLTMMWKKMGDVMIAKCAEALALRKAFPQDLSGLYTSDEMAQTANEEPMRDINPEATQQLKEAPRPTDRVVDAKVDNSNAQSHNERAAQPKASSTAAQSHQKNGPKPTVNVEEAGRFKFKFGQHVDKTISEIPEGKLASYAKWFRGNMTKEYKEKGAVDERNVYMLACMETYIKHLVANKDPLDKALGAGDEIDQAFAAQNPPPEPNSFDEEQFAPGVN